MTNKWFIGAVDLLLCENVGLGYRLDGLLVNGQLTFIADNGNPNTWYIEGLRGIKIGDVFRSVFNEVKGDDVVVDIMPFSEAYKTIFFERRLI